MKSMFRILKIVGNMYIFSECNWWLFNFRTWPFIIKSPKQYKNLSFMDAMNKFKWTKKEGLSFNKLVLSLPVNVRCSKTDNAEWSVSPALFYSLRTLMLHLTWKKLRLRHIHKSNGQIALWHVWVYLFNDYLGWLKVPDSLKVPLKRTSHLKLKLKESENRMGWETRKEWELAFWLFFSRGVSGPLFRLLLKP
jgi:hypothetical protein